MRVTATTIRLLAPALLLGATACGDDDDVIVAPPPTGAAVVSGDITADRTLYRDTVYTLSGFVHVTNGARLTIQSGTQIHGDANTLGSSLFVLRGAQLVAEGTAQAPIVFTSSKAAGSRRPGDWGGLIIVGNASLNRTGGGPIQVEGTGTAAGTTPGSNYDVRYGGAAGTTFTDNDNSGSLRYVRVEFAGFAPSQGNELNTFTFATVGSGTRLEYLQAVSGLDDSFEWFGGTVDGKFLLAYETGDDMFDMSEGYRGRLQYLIGYNGTRLDPATGAGSLGGDPQGIENDGCAGSGCTNGFNATPYTQPVVANYTLVGPPDVANAGSSGGVGMVIRRGSAGYYVNGALARWPRFAFSIADQETLARAGGSETAPQDLATADLAIKSVLVAEAAAAFQPAATGQPRFALATTGNNINVNPSGVTTGGLFTAFPTTVDATTGASAFDWTPTTGSALLSGGLTVFSGKLATAAGTAVSGTSWVGGAPPAGQPNARWWQGWSSFARN